MSSKRRDPKPLPPTPVGLPATLQGRLYLAAYNQRGRTFGGNNGCLFELSLRAASLTELLLQGHLIDVAGRTRRADPPPETASLRSMWDGVPPDASCTWADVIDSRPAVRAGITVPAELHEGGWLCEQRRRFAVMPGIRWQLPESATADEAAREARRALAGIVAQLPVSPRSRALGLLAFHAQLPTTISFNDDAHARAAVLYAGAGELAPLVGLAQVIQDYFADMRAQWACGGT